jgi:hypothetical protein
LLLQLNGKVILSKPTELLPSVLQVSLNMNFLRCLFHIIFYLIFDDHCLNVFITSYPIFLHIIYPYLLTYYTVYFYYTVLDVLFCLHPHTCTKIELTRAKNLYILFPVKCLLSPLILGV